jgi:N-acetylglucosamine-6-phosphate deacetylase
VLSTAPQRRIPQGLHAGYISTVTGDCLALSGGRLLTPDGLLNDHALVLDGGKIKAIVPADNIPPGCPIEDLAGHLLAPGFIDTQVNGGGGVLFNDAPTVQGIAAIGRAHRVFGTTGFLPTLITDDLPVMNQAMRAVEAAIEAGVPGVLGIHLEGPYLAPARCGVHDKTKFRVLDEAGVALLTSLRRGVTLVTLAPEAAAPPLIRRLTDAGVIVSLGHTDAPYAAVREALAQGATGFTHLFNAMSALASRAPGAVGAALESHAWCGLIVDGHHVDPAVLRLALRTRPAERFMLVTDAMPCVGAAAKDFSLQGRPIAVCDGICRDAAGTLAGSALDMASAVRNAIAMLGLTLPNASAMASANPAAFLGLAGERGALAPGLAADLVLLDAKLRVVKTWIAHP